MAVLTGANGELRFNGQRIAKCRNFTLDISRDPLETTGVGSTDRTYVEGIRGATGNATVLLDPDDSGTVALLNSILSDSVGASQVSMTLNTATSSSLQFDAVVTAVGVPVSVGEVTACSVSFQVSGAISGAF